jgi:dUTP pyrophosphatase
MIRIKRLPHGQGIELPHYASSEAAGMDVRAAVEHDLVIEPGERARVPTGLALAIPQGYEVQVRPRSGLAAKHGLTVCNAPGTIDSDYRGELQVLLVNLGQEPFTIERGLRIAQLVVAPVVQMPLLEVDELDSTTRGEGGFGSTGKH